MDGDAEQLELKWFGNGNVNCDAHSFPKWKRALDLTCVLCSLPVWFPLMLCLALWVMIVSPGPIFFRQKRVGYYGRRFMIYKFRSMKVNAATGCHENHFDKLVECNCPMTKLDAVGDPRMIRGGRFLRATGLDELPQIINVLLGEMSLVGPRPCTPREFSNYEGYRQERFSSPPGLTGYWQVNGKNRTTFSEMVDLDIYYARHMSSLLDLKIMARTLPALYGQVRDSWCASGRFKRGTNGNSRVEPGIRVPGAEFPTEEA